MRYLAWLIMASVFLITFFLTQDLILAFVLELGVLFVMLVFGKQFFFGDKTNTNQSKT